MKRLAIVAAIVTGLMTCPAESFAGNNFIVYFTNTNTNSTAEDQGFGALDKALERASQLISDRDNRFVRGIGKVWIQDARGQQVWPPTASAPVTPTPSVQPEPFIGSTWHRNADEVPDKNVMYGFVFNANKTADVLTCTKGESGASGTYRHSRVQIAKWNEPSAGKIYIDLRYGSYSWTLRGSVRGDVMTLAWYTPGRQSPLRTETYFRR